MDPAQVGSVNWPDLLASATGAGVTGIILAYVLMKQQPKRDADYQATFQAMQQRSDQTISAIVGGFREDLKAHREDSRLQREHCERSHAMTREMYERRIQDKRTT